MKKYISIVFIIALMLLTTSCSKPIEEMSVDELLETGEKYLADMKYEKAVVYFEHLIEIEPMNPRGYTGVAMAYSSIGQQEKAVAVLSDGLEIFVEDIEISINLLEQLIKVEKENPSWYKKLARIYIEAGDWEQAKSILNAGISEKEMSVEDKENLDQLIKSRTLIDEIIKRCSTGNYGEVITIMDSKDYKGVIELVDLVGDYEVKMDDRELIFFRDTSYELSNCQLVYIYNHKKVELLEIEMEDLTTEELEYIGEHPMIDHGDYVSYTVDGREGVYFIGQDGHYTSNYGDYVQTGDHDFMFFYED